MMGLPHFKRSPPPRTTISIPARLFDLRAASLPAPTKMPASETDQDSHDGCAATPARFKPGAKVEVTSSEPGFVGVWFEAEVLGTGRRRRLVVRYDHLIDNDDDSRFLEEVVDVSLVRPAPPRLAEPEELWPGDAVEALVNDGWWVGNVAERVENSVYVIVFPDCDPQKVNASDLRKRLDWVNGEWVAPGRRSEKETPRVMAVTKASEPMMKTMRKRRRPPGNSGKSKGKLPSPSKGKKQMKGNSQMNCVLSMHEFESIASGGEFQLTGMPTIVPEAITAGGGSKAYADERKDVAVNNLVSSSSNAKVDVEMDGKVYNGESDLTPLRAGDNVVSNKGKSVNSNGNPAESASLNNVVKPENPGRSHSSQELAIMRASAEAYMLNLSNTESGQANPELVVAEVLVPEPLLHYSFAKMTAVWDVVSALDIFRVMPQRPHFHPLEQVQEDCREGIALGHMINFAKLADSMRTLELDDPIEVLMKRLDALDDLEQQGFDAEIFKLCLKDLIQVKRSHEDLMRKQAQVETEVIQKGKESSKFAAEVDDINQNLRELEDKIAVLHARRIAVLDTREEWESMKCKLQMEIQVLQEKSDDLRSDFSEIVARTHLHRGGLS